MLCESMPSCKSTNCAHTLTAQTDGLGHKEKHSVRDDVLSLSVFAPMTWMFVKSPARLFEVYTRNGIYVGINEFECTFERSELLLVGSSYLLHFNLVAVMQWSN